MAEETQEKKPFYGAVKDTPVRQTPIEDPGVAREVAEVEATQGRDAALAREAALKRLHETGLTEAQRRNIEIMDRLGKKYPHAFEDITDDTGRRILRVRHGGPVLGSNIGNGVILTPDGQAFIMSDAPALIQKSHLIQMADVLARPGAIGFSHFERVSSFKTQSSWDQEVYTHNFALKRIDFSSPYVNDFLKTVLRGTEAEQIKSAQQGQQTAAEETPQAIVERL